MDTAHRNIPPVHELVDCLVQSRASVSRSLIVDATRSVLEDYRTQISGGEAPISREALLERIADRLDDEQRPPLAPAINATGIIVHTGLGRAPLAPAAVRAMADVAGHYAPVELDLASGRRGHRTEIVRGLLTRLTGAESATIVNNNAAGLVLVLSAIATGRQVIVSRGELIEIGGSFRLPDIMEASGAHLVEVGTTNRTRLQDYERAIDDDTAAVMKVHPSNYRVQGFQQEVAIDELAALARAHGVTAIHDVGSGALRPLDHLPLTAHEPAVAESIEAGADLVLFSGDKLLGGPQAGIIVGRRDMIARLERHPLMRALRVDKTTLAALGATLQLHLDAAMAGAQVPVHALATTPVGGLRARGERLAAALAGNASIARASVEDSEAYVGGGSLPAQALPSCALVVSAAALPEEELLARLRSRRVVGRASAGAVWLDLRTVFPQQDEQVLAAIREAVE